MRKPYCCDASQHLFNQYYRRQQNGGGDFPVYVGRVRQKGHGIGAIFKNIWRYLFPAIKSIAPHALAAGANFVQDVTSGNNWKQSAKKHGSDVLDHIPEAVGASIKQSGSGPSELDQLKFLMRLGGKVAKNIASGKSLEEAMKPEHVNEALKADLVNKNHQSGGSRRRKRVLKRRRDIFS
jgi:hypothetical protein